MYRLINIHQQFIRKFYNKNLCRLGCTVGSFAGFIYLTEYYSEVLMYNFNKIDWNDWNEWKEIENEWDTRSNISTSSTTINGKNTTIINNGKEIITIIDGKQKSIVPIIPSKKIELPKSELPKSELPKSQKQDIVRNYPISLITIKGASFSVNLFLSCVCCGSIGYVYALYYPITIPTTVMYNIINNRNIKEDNNF